jgi:N-acetylglucosaminyldiphosphoundecaprenol N-acetyl-beta-D-mannosaminyltransferase
VDDFDYPAIARMLEDFEAEVVWVALGAPKQEYFMHKLEPYLKKGVQLGVGAAFNFHAGMNEKRAPKWMIRNRMEFVYRIMQDPKKQLRRCGLIVTTLPKIFWGEMRRRRKVE